ncbi:MAG: bacteriocin system secretion protein [Acidobacteria bacterium]|jgi:HlyD family secretion protein|nr:bacteriocin system secretion protein [Acidobacteriota bacterium]
MDPTKVFRKVALERMSSPDQLDQLLHVTTARNWLALLALIALLGAAVAWGYKGQLTTKVVGQGVLIRSGGVQSVIPLGAGQVIDIRVRVGDHIAVGQVIGTVAQPAFVEKIKIAKGQLTDAMKQKEDIFKVRSDRSRLQLAFLERQRANLEREIQELQQEARIVEEQIPVDEELLSKGLVTKQQVYLTRQKLVGIQGSISSRRAQFAQLDAQEYQTENESLEANLEHQNRITDLQRELQALESEFATQATVVSPYAGQVLEVKVSPGSFVQVGTPIISLQPDVENLETLVYVPSVKAKDVRPGMAVEISPSTVKREEYGFIRGKVVFVADYPATEAALMRIFENEPLVRALTAGGPATEIRAEMDPDPATPSGFRWSSPQGAPLKLSAGTICAVEIVVRTQRPISMIFPYIKEKVGMR